MHLFNDLWASFIYVFSLGTMVQDLCSKQLKGTMAQLISLPSLSLKLQPCPKSRNKSSPKSKKKKKPTKGTVLLQTCSVGYFLLFGVIV